MAQHQARLLNLLDALLQYAPDAPLSKLQVEAELACIAQWNDTGRDWDLSRSLDVLIEEQATRTPTAIAVSYGDEELTYDQLIVASDRLATHLLSLGVGPGQYVGVCDSRSLYLPVALLAIMKTGAAYLPLDTAAPPARLAFQIQDAGIAHVLSRRPLFDLLTESGANLLALDDLLHKLPAVDGPLPSAAMPNSAAYVIYTSGSTGQPKGVAVPHCGVVNRLLWMQAQYGLTMNDRILQKTPYTFDVSVWEFFWPLITGARLVIAEPESHHDPRRIAALIQQHQISTLHFVPPMLDLFLESLGSLPSLRRVFCSGDVLRPATVTQFFQRFPSGVGLYNLYGPTEASIDVTHWTCRPTDAYGSVPIGYPVANTQIHLLDPTGRLVALGATGELYIAGVQVAQGYLNRPELTAERFIVDPWRVGGRMYRTGDLARYRDDGAIEFLGRIDNQLKIRGLRVEAGEVESVLMRHPTVQQAVVSAWQPTDGDRRLIAHVVPALDQTLDQAMLAAHLATQLPDYMIPQHVVVLDALPLSSNGKLDRTALPAPQLAISEQTTDWQSPQEAALAAVWQTLLGVVPPLDVSFFALGGDSMLAIRSRTLLEQQGYSHEVTDLFRWPTIRQLAPQLRSGVSPTISSAPFALLQTQDRHRISADVEDAYPLSAMQGGMLFHAELAQDSAVYRVVTSLNVRAPFDEAALRQALDATVLRHPILRTYFDLSSYSEPLQLVATHARAPLEVLEYTDNMAAEVIDAELEQWVAQAKNARFDLSQAPLMRFTVHLRDAQQFQLSVVEHHVILDGWSDAVMLDEILQRYQSNLNGQNLWFSALASSYRDFIATERTTLAEPQARDFWQTYLQDAEPTLLPRRQGKSSAKAHSRAWPVVVEPGMLGQLQQLARQQGLPLKNLLCAAHVMVQRLAGNTSEVLTGLVVNARLEHEGGDEVLGVFLNTLPLRLDTQAQTPLSMAQAITRFEQRSAPWRRYPMTAMGLQVTLDSYFNFIDFHSLWQQQGQQGRLVQQGIGVAETNFPLAANFLVDPVSQQLQVWLDCDPVQLDEAFCQRLAGYYSRALSALLQHADTPLSKLDLLNPVEHAQFDAWNHTTVPFDHSATVHELIALQAAAQPDAIAVLHRDQQISYQRLQERANQLAHHLQMQGVEPGSLVGISLYRGIDMVVALLAVLQAGCAYVPLDPDYPLARLHYIVQDSQMAALITCEASPVSQLLPQTILLDLHARQIEQHAPTSLGVVVDGEAAAYVIYTSGSTGNPKGTRIRHRNVINFFVGMDERIGCTQDDVVLAQTSISFDISVLEILWPLARGARVVMAGERILHNLAPDPALPLKPLQLSLFFFAAPAGQEQQREGYQLLLDAAKEADRLGLAAIWTPERHFHEFGGLYPNPSVMMAALASVTQRIGLRCGSVVAPLHDSLRLAEEWSLVDNLSGGRVGLAFASGWNSNDFALAPQNYADRKQIMNTQLEEFRQLWRGEALLRVNGSGEQVALRIYPQPVQAEPQIWLTSAGAVDTFARAGASGANLLTHLLGQELDELAQKISAYRLARQQAGHAGPGHVTLMVHTFLGDDSEAARAAALGPFRDYLRTSTELWKPLFASMGVQFDDSLSEADLDSVLERAVDRYFERAGLFGSPESVASDLRALAIAGANEIACLIDFGLSREAALHGVSLLGRLKQLHEAEVLDGHYNLAQLCQRHEVSMLQGTPSLLAAVTATPPALAAMSKVRSLLVGGEAFPMGLAERLQQALPATQIFNMYGPTETTVWSTVHALHADSAMEGNVIPIGRPIANTEILVLNDEMQLLPAGVAGELWIGGDGVAELYVGQPELTLERFVPHPNGDGVLYRTGDRVRWREDGLVEFLGRVDRQVKILGHRIEPDEVESVLSRHPAVEAVAVIARTVNGQAELAAYIAPNLQGSDVQAAQDHVAHWASIWEHAYADPNQGTAHSEFAGWASSYTGEEIASSEMKEWLKHTVNSVLKLQPRTLVEVGVYSRYGGD